VGRYILYQPGNILLRAAVYNIQIFRESGGPMDGRGSTSDQDEPYLVFGKYSEEGLKVSHGVLSDGCDSCARLFLTQGRSAVTVGASEYVPQRTV